MGGQGTPPDAARRTRAEPIRWRLADFYDAAIDAQCPKRPGSPARSRPGGPPS